ncbi:hypothetical protein [Streptomyces decoyicus]
MTPVTVGTPVAVGCPRLGERRRSPDGTCALVLDDRQRTTVDGVWAAGETGGVGGAELSFLEGELAARAITRQIPGGALRWRRDRLRRFARTMAAAHAPRPGWTGRLREDTDVCRCEEVTAGRIQEAVAGLAARDTRTVKLLTGPEWAGARAGGAPPPSPAWRGRRGPRPTADRLPVPSPWGTRSRTGVVPLSWRPWQAPGHSIKCHTP